MEFTDLQKNALNGDLFVRLDFARILKGYKPDVFIETGTYHGQSTLFIASLDSDLEIHTIENNNEHARIATERLKGSNNVQIHKGDSAKVFETLLPDLSKKHSSALFYLDAHWDDYWPLNDELKIIGKYFKNNCMIIIDDFQVPRRPKLRYDTYKTTICDAVFVNNGLNEVFDQPFVWYNDVGLSTHENINWQPSGKLYALSMTDFDKVSALVKYENGHYYSNIIR